MAEQIPAAAVEAPRARPATARLWAAAAAASWTLLCLRWFDAAAPLRPRIVSLLPPWLLAASFVLAAAVWWTRRERTDRAPWWRDQRLLLVVALAVLFRLPLAWQGAAGYVTADGALSGLMALDVRDGRDHAVFVPHVPYSGSLKAHLTAPLAMAMDAARAFALVSVLFYAAFVAALFRLASAAAGPSRPLVPLAAGLYAAFAPAFVTRYSLSNDGNYVEVLAFGTWALVSALRWVEAPAARPRQAWAMGILLGLAFWAHILAVIPAAAIAAFLALDAPRRALMAAPRMAAGFVLGDLPGLLWNAANGGDSFAYLRPGAVVSAEGTHDGLLRRAATLVADHLIVLLGYDFGYPPPIDRALKVAAAVALVAVVVGIARAARRVRGESGRPWRLLLLFTAVNLLIAVLALPYIPGNPRYLLFLMAALPVFLADALAGGRGRALLAAMVAVNAVASLAQGAVTMMSDARWRALVKGLEDDGVRWCYTDFYLATKINFLSEQRVICSAKLGPTTIEYFFRFRDAVERAPEAALVAVNATSAEKLERHLDRLGIKYRRHDLMKPVLFGLSRKVDPEELFPERAFPLR
ncbi:MAG: hypothetical protein DMF78_09165 [Acidobacteria bacterium]|nr:MAG: hypothetical protein DMF78_09165 [Acidobacteriota bacterium]